MKNRSTENSGSAMVRVIVICLALALIAAIAFSKVYQFDFVNYDDDRYVFQNTQVSTGLTAENIAWAFKSMHAGNWHPLTWISLMADAQLFHLNAGGYHIVNLLFHILNAVLVFVVLRLMTGGLWRSAAVAALFALHPLHVESVAWVSERKDVLSTFFMLLTLWAYSRYARAPGYRTYLPTFLFFALGLMAKPMLVTLPFILLLLDYWPLGRFALGKGEELPKGVKRPVHPVRRNLGRLIYEKLPLFGLSAGSIVLTIFAQKQEIMAMHYLPVALRIENALVACCGYLAKMFLPVSLAVLYPHPEFIAAWKIIGAASILIAVTVLAIWMLRRHPWFLIGWLWYLGALIPVIGIVQVGVQSMADRYTYIPFIGVFIAIVWLVSELAERVRYGRIVAATLFVVILGVLFAATWIQLDYWRNSQTLFSRALSVTADNYVAHSNMGALFARKGNLQDAGLHYREALRIQPGDLEANYNLANLLLREGKFGEALPYYEKAIRVRPDFAPAHNNMGIALGQSGNLQKALEQFREAVRLDPGYEEALNNLKIAEAKQESPKEIASAGASSAKANVVKGEVDAGIALVKKGDLAGAIGHFRAAVKDDPNYYEANVHLGLALAHQQKTEEAIPYFRKAIEIQPKQPEVYNSLGVALASTGKVDEAVVQLKKAIRIDPGFAKGAQQPGGDSREKRKDG